MSNAVPRLQAIRLVSEGWINKYVLTYAMPDGSLYEYESASRKKPDAYRRALEASAGQGVPAAFASSARR